MVQFTLREAMWWFVMACAMAGAVFATPSPASLLTSMLLFAMPLVMICAYLWVRSDEFGRRWMVLVAGATSIALLITVPLHGASFFEPLLFAPIAISRTSEFVVYGAGCVGIVVGFVTLMASLAGAWVLIGRNPIGWLALLFLAVWLFGWLNESRRLRSDPLFGTKGAIAASLPGHVRTTHTSM